MPFPDHHPPPLDLYLKLVEMIDNWLRADDNHVAVVHCKGGKGRTGTVIVSLLYFRGECSTVEEAEQLFASMRSSKSKGVTQPSQRRYIKYFKTILVRNQFINFQPIRLRSVTIAPLLSERPILLQIFNGVTDDAPLLFSQMREPIAFNDATSMVKYNIELDVRGDLYFKVFRRRDKDKVERAFHVVMHSYFITSPQYILERSNLDHLKTSDRRFSNELTMTFQFAQPQTARLYTNSDDLHERMTRKHVNYISNIPPSIAKRQTRAPTIDAQFSTALSTTPRGTIAAPGDTAVGEELPGIGLMNHPLVSTHVKYAIQASSTAEPSDGAAKPQADLAPASMPPMAPKSLDVSDFEDDMLAPPDEPPPLPPSSGRDSWMPRRPSLQADSATEEDNAMPPETAPKPPSISGRTLGQFRKQRKSMAPTQGQIRRSGDLPPLPESTSEPSSTTAALSPLPTIPVSPRSSPIGSRPALPSIGAPSAPLPNAQRVASPPAVQRTAGPGSGWAPASPSTSSGHLRGANRFTLRTGSTNSLTSDVISPRSLVEASPRTTGDSSDFASDDDSFSSDESDSEEYFDADYIAEVLDDLTVSPLPRAPSPKHQSEKLPPKRPETLRPTRLPPAPAKQ